MPAGELARFTLTDRLDHTWLHERVGFHVDNLPLDQNLAILDEQDNPHPCQAVGSEVWFYVDELPAMGTRTYRLVTVEEEVVAPGRAVHAVQQGKWMIVETPYLAVRLAAGQNEDGSWPAPFLGMRGGSKHWMGGSRIAFSEALVVENMVTEALEVGPLWQKWQVRYECTTGETYTMWIRIFGEEPYVEFHEESRLNRDSWLIFDTEGLDPDHMWTHRHKLDSFGGKHGNLGSIQMPVYSGVWVPDDYYYAVLINERGESPDSLAVCGIEGSYWDYPYANQIDIERHVEAGPAGHDKGVISLNMSIKAGHRAWLLMLADQEQVLTTTPHFDNPVHRVVKQYETPLHKVKDYVLDWGETPPAQRPFAIADGAQLEQARQRAVTYDKFREYVESLDPELPGDYTYYHSGTHRTFEPHHRNDPAVLYVTGSDPEERRKQAGFLKEVVIEGLAHRRHAMLRDGGHTDQHCASINLGRGLRPWAALYDLAASEGVFSEEEARLVQATFAFFCYKIMDRDFWPAEALILRDDHPRSAHRTHWFPGRHSDWAFYNIDNIPHNFHGDLWSALGCMAIALPRHPLSREWVDQTLEWWESELTQWVFAGGAWLESSTYTLNSMKDYLIYCRMLKNARIRDYFSDERLQRAFRFIAEALGPHDERIGGRSLPVMGDGGYPNGFCYVLGWMAGLTRDVDPDFSRLMSLAWKSTGEYLTEPGRFGLNFCDFLFIDPEIPAAEPASLTSHWYRGMGAILRHAHGTPDEIWMFIKAGIIYSHFHEPEGTFQLWWNSSPLCDEYGVQYGKGTDDKPTSSPECHNCIEIEGLETAYNKGDVTTFVSTEAFDYVIVDSPMLPAYLEEGQWIWGFRGEMGPAGWHRRHFLLVKPYFLYVYDELESPYPTIYHLNIKADGKRQEGNVVHYDGRLGTDLEVAMLNLGDRQIEHSEFDVDPRSQYGFQPPPGFYHQLQLHVRSEGYTDYASVLVPHASGQAASVASDPESGGAAITHGRNRFRAFLFPKPHRIATGEIVFNGRAGAIEQDGDTLAFHVADGTRCGVPGRLLIDGEGPYTARLDGDQLEVASTGVARWLTIEGPAFQSATRDGESHDLEQLSQSRRRLYLPAGPGAIVLRL